MVLKYHTNVPAEAEVTAAALVQTRARLSKLEQ